MAASSAESADPPRAPRLLERVALEARRRRLAPATERAYRDWVRRFVLFHGRRHPRELGAGEVAAFLGHLATERGVAAATQNQALAALLFLYRDVLGIDLGALPEATRARRPKRLPTVLSRAEARRLLEALRQGGRAAQLPWLVASLLYGGGLRVKEALRLRVQDLDFDRFEFTVRAGKGDRDRRTTLPATLVEPLREHLARVRELHAADLAAGRGDVALPHALAAKLPGAARDWAWQWVFPAPKLSTDPRTGRAARHHVYPERIQRAVRAAAQRQARDLPHPAPQLRDPPARSGLRHPHRPGAARPPPGLDHDGLHPRPQQGRPRRPQPPRPRRMSVARRPAPRTGFYDRNRRNCRPPRAALQSCKPNGICH